MSNPLPKHAESGRKGAGEAVLSAPIPALEHKQLSRSRIMSRFTGIYRFVVCFQGTFAAPMQIGGAA